MSPEISNEEIQVVHQGTDRTISFKRANPKNLKKLFHLDFDPEVLLHGKKAYLWDDEVSSLFSLLVLHIEIEKLI